MRVGPGPPVREFQFIDEIEAEKERFKFPRARDEDENTARCPFLVL